MQSPAYPLLTKAAVGKSIHLFHKDRVASVKNIP